MQNLKQAEDCIGTQYFKYSEDEILAFNQELSSMMQAAIPLFFIILAKFAISLFDCIGACKRGDCNVKKS